jgi:acetoin utilization protein AcuB
MLDKPIREYMSKAPLTIGRRQTLTTAHELMRGRRVRHLPVLEAGKLVGVVSQDDLHFLESLKDVEPDEVLVEEAMSADPYWVSATTPLSEVARTMARGKLGSTVVVDGGKVVGVFTATDALKILASLSSATRARVPPKATSKAKPKLAAVEAKPRAKKAKQAAAKTAAKRRRA